MRIMPDIFYYIVAVFIINQCNMATKFKNYSPKLTWQKHHYIVYVADGAVFPQSLRGCKKTEPYIKGYLVEKLLNRRL